MSLPHRPAGSSGLEVSALALGSWQTYERIPREQGVAVLDAARDAGIDFLEVARYNDTTGTAPIPTGYSEVVFGEVFARSAYAPARDEVIVAEKLWWEFWPEQNALQELTASLERTGLERVDLLYSDPPPADLPLAEVVAQIGALLDEGRIRAWGIVNWPAERVAQAGRIALDSGIETPCLVQLPYSLVNRDWVEGADMVAALELCDASVTASWTLAGGLLSGKYAKGAGGRMEREKDDPKWASALRAADELGDLAREVETTAATLAIAWALNNPSVATVLFGATRPEQIAENASAPALLERLDEEQLARLEAIGTTEA
jgi:aryl-alcohol dehydrogenase-like predicted oxidoreductase